MRPDDLLRLLRHVADGSVAPEEALQELRTMPFARTASGLSLDTHRELRTGMAEVVFAPGKSDVQLTEAVQALHERGQPALVTRLAPDKGELLTGRFPSGENWPEAGLFALGGWALRVGEQAPPQGDCIIVTAGGADMPVALEALGTSRFMGLDPGLISDVGVAGLHRLEPHLHALCSARLLIVCAGMEGALPSVLGGLCGRPLIAVPTSVGYGASFQGLAALLGMLNSCAPGVAVVNIDNGFGAAVLARKLLDMHE